MIEHDVLVIGGGLAGMRASLEALKHGADVAMISKVYPTRSHSAAAQGGINAAIGLEDSWEVHAFETVRGSDFLGDQDAIEILCQEGVRDIFELDHMGVIFDRDSEGRIHMRGFGGTLKSRTCHVGDMTGQVILHVMYEQLLRANLKSYDEWFVSSLVVDDGECWGVVAMEVASGRLELIKAKSVILCTGGLGRVYEPSTNGLVCTGDGIALAYKAGARLMDMEMVQYHPTTLKANGFLITEGARGEGAYLLNSKNERFLSDLRYGASKYMEFASRDVISRAETIEIQEGRGIEECVLLDCRHIKDRILQAFHQIYELALDYANIDITQQPLPVRPGMHYLMGGIKADIDGQTAVAGLYAAGECACVSVHGANRLGGNSLLDCVVFGRRSGAAAAKRAESIKPKKIPETRINEDRRKFSELFNRPDKGLNSAKLRLELGTLMDKYVGVFRNEEGLQTASKMISELKARYKDVSIKDKGEVFNTDLLSTLELGYILDCAETIVASALTRKETRGAHSRTDYPKRDDKNWLKHVLVYSSPDGAKTEFLPVKITKWEPEERRY